jgi:hypothetical protein
MTRRLRTLATILTERGDGSQLPYIALENVAGGEGRLLSDAVLEDRDSSDAVPVQPGDVLFGKLRPYLAKVLHVDGEVCASPELLAVRPGDDLDSRYLYYVCLSKPFLDWAVATSYGVKMPRTSWDLLSQYRPFLPEIRDQRRIADYLDTQCLRINAAVEEQSRLLAFSGSAVSRWCSILLLVDRRAVHGVLAFRGLTQSLLVGERPGSRPSPDWAADTRHLAIAPNCGRTAPSHGSQRGRFGRFAPTSRRF